MRKLTVLMLGASSLLVAVAGAAHSAKRLDGRAVPVESPGVTEDCYEYVYPKKDACGALSGTSECKATPTIEASDDEKKRAECEPTKGELCLCD